MQAQFGSGHYNPAHDPHEQPEQPVPEELRPGPEPTLWDFVSHAIEQNRVQTGRRSKKQGKR